jgi:hypothetical protein
VASFLKLDRSDEDKRKILWDNGARFYGVTRAVEEQRAERSKTFAPPPRP